MNYPEGQIAIANLDIRKQQFILPNLKNSIEDHLSVVVAWVLVAVFLGTAFVNGFSSKSLFGSGALFVTSEAHNTFDFAYLATSIGIAVAAFLGEKVSISFMRAIGKVYVFVALIGFAKLGTYNYSEWISIINLGLGMTLTTAGSLLQNYRHDLLVARLITKQRQPNSYTIMDVIRKTTSSTVQEENGGTNGKRFHCNDSSEASFIKGEFI